MNLKKIVLILLVVLIGISLGFVIFRSVEARKKDSEKIQVVVSNFASYDFLRAIIGENDNVKLTFILGAGKDTHSYDPTPQDIVTIQKADLFVYVGGEMEKWVDKVLDSLDNKEVKTICIADYVDTIEEKEVDGAEEHEHEDEDEHHEEGEEHEEYENEHEEGAFDEHIWTSPANAIKMVNKLEQEMEELDKENAEKYKKNAEAYITKIKEVDSKIQEVVDNKVRNRLIFGDKMPMQYFIDYYKLEVSAAFNGCSTETEPGTKTITYLIDKAKQDQIPVILYIELNNGRVAEIIANEVGGGCKAMQIQALHNVSLDDFNNGETWVSLMERNIDVLKKALQ